VSRRVLLVVLLLLTVGNYALLAGMWFTQSNSIAKGHISGYRNSAKLCEVIILHPNGDARPIPSDCFTANVARFYPPGVLTASAGRDAH
jgi:hypothetical protein